MLVEVAVRSATPEDDPHRRLHGDDTEEGNET
jgi:hypothetical protein